MRQISANKYTLCTFLPISNPFAQYRLIKKVQAKLSSGLVCTIDTF